MKIKTEDGHIYVCLFPVTTNEKFTSYQNTDYGLKQATNYIFYKLLWVSVDKM